MYTLKILDIIPTPTEAERLGLAPSARCAIVEDGNGNTRMLSYMPRAGTIHACASSVEWLFDEHANADDLIPDNDDAFHLSGHDARTWLGYGFTCGGLVDWCGAGIFEPSIAADLRRLGIDPLSQREALTECADSLMCDEMTVDEFRALVFREDS